MTAPMTSDSDPKKFARLGTRASQLERRPAAVDPATVASTGWTVVFGDGNTPVVTGDYQAIWEVSREIVGDGTTPWYIYSPSAKVKSPSTSLDIEIWLYRVRNGTLVSAIIDEPLVIDATTYSSRASASPVVVTQYANLLDEDGGPNYDSIMVGIDVAGDATGLSINVPIGAERVPGSGYR